MLDLAGCLLQQGREATNSWLAQAAAVSGALRASLAILKALLRLLVGFGERTEFFLRLVERSSCLRRGFDCCFEKLPGVILLAAGIMDAAFWCFHVNQPPASFAMAQGLLQVLPGGPSSADTGFVAALLRGTPPALARGSSQLFAASCPFGIMLAVAIVACFRHRSPNHWLLEKALSWRVAPDARDETAW